MSYTPYPDILNVTTEKVIASLSSIYITNFFTFIQSDHGVRKNTNNKLRTYAVFKISYEMEKYLDSNLTRPLVSAISKLRTCTHSLEIETGRYARPRIPPEQRVCRMCNLNHTEDEMHFLFQCPAYEDYRKSLYDQIPELQTISDHKLKLKLVMSLQNELLLTELGLFIVRSFQRRKIKQSSG